MNNGYYVKELLRKTIEASVKGGLEINGVLQSNEFKVDYKEDNSPVTIADIRAGKVIEKALSVFKMPFISEEEKIPSYGVRKDWQQYWLVDPLDGTKEFVRRGSDFTVNIALIEDNYPVLGVIYAPALKKLYFGAANYGAFKCIDVTKPGPESILQRAVSLPLDYKRSKFTIAGSRSHMNQETIAYIDKIKKEKGKENVDIIICGSSLKMCMVAEGKAALYPRLSKIMEWDIAAGHAICEAAGCTVLQWNGQKLQYNKADLSQPWFVVKKGV